MVTLESLPAVPSLVVGEVGHSRVKPQRHTFRHRAYQWLVDIDDLPRLPRLLRPLARFDATDHLDGGRLGGGIRGDLTRFLAHRGVLLQDDDRVLMLSNARVFGYIFNPLSVFWCLSADGQLRAVVFEVHNTYGERHAYLLDVDSDGRTSTDKSFYVSPFNDVSGRYDISLRLDQQIVSVAITLLRNDVRVFAATTRGEPEQVTTRALLRVVGTHPFMTQRVSALIRMHGIWLWLRKMPVMARTPHPKEAVR